MSYVWSIDGTDLATSFTVLAGTQSRPDVSARNYVVEVPGRHGAIVSGLTVFEAPLVALQIRLKRSTEALFESGAALLRAMLATPAGVTLTREAGGVSASATGHLRSLTSDVHAYGSRETWTAIFTVPGVFFRGASTTTELSVWDGLQGIPSLSGSSAPVSDASFRVTGPCLSMHLACPVSGTSYEWDGVLNAGQYLFLHPGRQEAWISAVSTAWDGTGVQEADNVTFNANGPLSLWPSVSGTALNTSVYVTGDGRSPGVSKLHIQARKAYL